jgi:hypothetical protein
MRVLVKGGSIVAKLPWIFFILDGRGEKSEDCNLYFVLYCSVILFILYVIVNHY